MNLYLRLILVFFKSIFHLGTYKPMDTSIVRLTVLPTDLDTNLHLSNSIYLSMMDLGRVDLIARLGMIRHVFFSGWQPMIGNAYLRFRRGLSLFQRLQVESRVVFWDDKWVYIEQTFVHRGRAVAQGLVKGLFCKKGKPIPMREVFHTMGWEMESPKPPGWVKPLIAVDDAISTMNG